MWTSIVKDFKNGKKYLCKDFYIDCNIYGIYGNKYQWEIRKELDDSFVASGYTNTRSSALKAARDKRRTIVDLYNGKEVNGKRYIFSEK